MVQMFQVIPKFLQPEHLDNRRMATEPKVFCLVTNHFVIERGTCEYCDGY